MESSSSSSEEDSKENQNIHSTGNENEQFPELGLEKEEEKYNSIMDENGIFRFPEELYIPPEDFPKTNNNSTLWNWILRKFM